MKYIFYVLRIRHGDYEFYEGRADLVPDDIEPAAFVDEKARMYYASEEWFDENGNELDEPIEIGGEKEEGMDEDVYFFNCGDLAVKIDSWVQIPEEHFKIMQKYGI